MGVNQRSTAVEHLDVFFGQVFLVDTVETPNVLFPIFDQLSPVEAFLLHIETVAFSIANCMGEVCSVPHDFFRHTTAVNTGAAVAIKFDHRAFCTVA